MNDNLSTRIPPKLADGCLPKASGYRLSTVLLVATALFAATIIGSTLDTRAETARNTLAKLNPGIQSEKGLPLIMVPFLLRMAPNSVPPTSR